jgi:hypothetical protein
MFPMLRTASVTLLLLAGCASSGSSFEDRRLATIPEDARVIVPVSFSRDGRRAAYVEQRGNACRTVSGSKVGKPYGVVC